LLKLEPELECYQFHIQPIGERDAFGHNQDEQNRYEQPFWQFDEAIGEGLFYGETSTIRLKAHISEEQYHRVIELDEIIPVQAKIGTRIYVLAKPYILEPDYRISIGLYPQIMQQAAVGEVVSSDWIGMRHREVGQAQAWLYPEERALMLWECFLEERYRQEDPRTDETLHNLWRGFEGFLLGHLPNVEEITTPSWEPIYDADREVWPQFLEGVGYRRIGEWAFGKVVGPKG
jgi:hypothetical protein